METDLLSIAASAAMEIATPTRLLFLFLGVVIGLVLGVIPGLSGLVGLSLLLPFTYDMDIVTAMAFLLGLSSVVVTSDTIPAVLFGVPGTVGSAATILDGYPMARQGRAAVAFGAAFSASVIGGLFGAVLLGVSVPVLRPVMLGIATPELLAICIFGLSLVAVLSGASPMKGIATACIGIALTSIGDDSQTATLRWTFDTLYLYDGIPIVPVALGLFAIPEIADLVISRQNISKEHQRVKGMGQFEGIRATFQNWFLVLRCSSIGSLLGAVPGIGASIIDWIAYAHARRTEKGANETFGTGDVRGVIASESSNNAKEGGALIPTIAFGVPGSASMAILLGAFMIQGMVPGPDMLTKHLDVTYSMVWSVAIANIFGAGICFLFANQLARVALVPIGILAPVVLSFVFVGAFQGSSHWGDIAVLFSTGLLGFVMKRLQWPRPPLILGFVLGALLERYTFISVSRYGEDWLYRPAVSVILAVALLGVLRPLWRQGREHFRNREKIDFAFQRHHLDGEFLFLTFLFLLFGGILASSAAWDFEARLFPQSNAWVALFCLTAYGLRKMLFRQTSAAAGQVLDIASAELNDLASAYIFKRAAVFALWCGLFVGAAKLVGFLFAIFVFTLLFIRLEGNRSWKLALSVGGAMFAVSYLLFHYVLRLLWPHSYLGDMFPDLRSFVWTGFV